MTKLCRICRKDWPTVLSYVFVLGMLLASAAIFHLPSDPFADKYWSELWVNGDFARPGGELTDVKAISAGGGYNLALKSDGSIVGWGVNARGQAVPPAGNDYAAVSAGAGYGAALKKDGSIVTWGAEGVNGLRSPPAGNDFVAIEAGTFWSLAIKKDGSIVTWGAGPPSPPAGYDFVAVSTCNEYALALRADGSIVSWGEDTDRRVPPPADNNYVAVSVSETHCLALKSDGSIVVWRHFDNPWDDDAEGYVVPPEGNDYVAVSAGRRHSSALKSDGSIVSWGENSHGQVTPPEGNDYVAVSAGYRHSIALTSDGRVVGWGSNEFGQTGHFGPLKVLIDVTKFDFWASMITSIYCAFYDFPDWALGQLGLRGDGINWYPAYLLAGLTGFLFGRYLHRPVRYVYAAILACIVYDNPSWHIWEFGPLFVRCNIILVVFCFVGLSLRFIKTKKLSVWYGCIDLALIVFLIVLGSRLCTPSDL